MNIYIARHGQSEWNLIRRIQGQTNTRLSPAGVQQGLDLAQFLKRQSMSKIFSSSLYRTIQTANPLAEQLNLIIQSSKLLNELAFGVLEGKDLFDFDEEAKKIWDWWMEDPVRRRIPGGESYRDLQRRAETFLKDNLNLQDQLTVLIVGHFRINQMLLGCLLDIPASQAVFIKQENNSIYHYRQGKQIRRAEISSQAYENTHWQSGLAWQKDRLPDRNLPL